MQIVFDFKYYLPLNLTQTDNNTFTTQYALRELRLV